MAQDRQKLDLNRLGAKPVSDEMSWAARIACGMVALGVVAGFLGYFIL